jgi:hypothetical protein
MNAKPPAASGGCLRQIAVLEKIAENLGMIADTLGSISSSAALRSPQRSGRVVRET